MDVINVISLILTIMVIAMFGYQFFYILVSLIDEIKTRIQKNNQYKDILNGVAKAEDFIEKDGEPHRFGFVIAARNGKCYRQLNRKYQTAELSFRYDRCFRCC